MWENTRGTKANSIAVEQFIPFLFDGSYDNSCTLEIGHKDMNLTCDLADELKVLLPLGRIVRDHYDETIRRYNSQDGHIIVFKITEQDNNISMKIPNFFAPSKYGVNPNFIRTNEMVTDQWGRFKPKLPSRYNSQPFTPNPNQSELIEILTDYMTYINYLIYKECLDLGTSMGLSNELLKKVIFWSVGTCWVTDNYEKYIPDANVIKKMNERKTQLKLNTTSKIISTLL